CPRYLLSITSRKRSTILLRNSSAACWHRSASRKKRCTAGRARPPRKKRRRDLAYNSEMASRIKIVLEMIKFEHSVFALPFALTGALLAARATHQPPRGWPTLRQILWIVVAMVAARSPAMTMHSIADIRYDCENPRTKQRALPTGALSVSFAWIFTLIAVAVFLASAGQLNPLALKLAT